MQNISPFRIMNTLFFGLGASVFYGLIGVCILYKLHGFTEVQTFLVAYTISFNTLFSFGLIFGTALIVFRTQNVIPYTIEDAFTNAHLSKTKYFFYKKRF